ncbi:MAG TPA: histidine phosphatase family protein [Candidatus Limnocylindrales bacterium]|jgi:probable phosphoglycerate mutase
MTDEDRPRAWLIRHGETEWSRAGKHTSLSDIPLTEQGRAEAKQVRSKLEGHRFALVLSSPRSRAFETARLAGFGDQVEVTDDLAEWDYGVYEGRTTAEIRETEPGWSVWTHSVTGGETAEQVGRRVDRVIARVLGGGGDALLFAHKHVLRVLAARWLDLPPIEGRHFALDTATVSVLGWEREDPVVERWNEACVPG